MRTSKTETVFYRLLLSESKFSRQEIINHETQKISYCVSNIDINNMLQKPIYTIMQCSSNNTNNAKTYYLEKSFTTK